MKRTYIILLVISLILGSLLGCGQKTAGNSSKTSNTTEVQTPAKTDEKETDQVKSVYPFQTYILWVPGASYTVDNFDGRTSTLYTSTGTLPNSTISVNKDGTYSWNSAWDGKIINGKWEDAKDGKLTLLKGQEGKNWTLEKGGGVNEDIFILDGFTWYSGKAVTLKKGTKK